MSRLHISVTIACTALGSMCIGTWTCTANRLHFIAIQGIWYHSRLKSLRQISDKMSIEEFNAILDGKPVVRKQRRKARHTEHDMQVACINWFRYVYPHFIIYAIPNGGARDMVSGRKLKDEGVLAGVPDLCIPVARHGFHSLYIEMKNGQRGIVSDKQKSVINRLKEQGHCCIVCRSLDHFIEVVTKYLKE